MEIKKVGVVGCGFMGSGIVQISAQAGYEVTTIEIDDAALQKGLSSINHFLSRAVEKGKIPQHDKDATMSRIRGSTDMNSLSDCDIVTEVVVEDLELKKRIFAEIDKLCP